MPQAESKVIGFVSFCSNLVNIKILILKLCLFLTIFLHFEASNLVFFFVLQRKMWNFFQFFSELFLMERRKWLDFSCSVFSFQFALSGGGGGYIY